MKTNEEWLRTLRAHGAEQDDALKELREILVHGMRAYFAEDRGYNSAQGSEAGQIVEDCAQEALLIIQRKIGTFRGESRFTTWATTIAIRQLLGELRRRKWKDLSIEASSIGRDLPKQPVEALQSDTPEMALEQDEVWSLLKRIVEKDLTSRQRFVLIASAFQGMPLDLIADKLGTNRDNVYKNPPRRTKKIEGMPDEGGHDTGGDSANLRGQKIRISMKSTRKRADINTVTWEKFRWLIRSIFAVQDKEILCSKFFDILPRYVDLQLEGKDVEKFFPEVGHHLHQCPECNEVYQALLQAVQSEKDRDKK